MSAPSTPQGATYQSLGWSLREWRRASPWSQKGRGSRNTKRERWTHGTGAKGAPREVQGSSGVLLSAPQAPLCPRPGAAGSGGRSAGVAPSLCAVPRPDRLDRRPGAALAQPSASAPRTLAASAPPLTGLPALRVRPSPKRKPVPPKLCSFTFISH